MDSTADLHFDLETGTIMTCSQESQAKHLSEWEK